jgi:hypothetical protein
LLLLASVFISGCDPITLIKNELPKESDAFSRNFIEDLRSGDIDSAHERLAEDFKDEEVFRQLKVLSEQLSASELLELNLIIYSRVKGMINKNERSQFTYEFVFEEGWGVANVVVDFLEDTRVITGIYFEPLDRPLAEINQFSLKGKDYNHYIMFAFAILVPLFVLCTIIHCIRSFKRHSTLWVLFMLLGIGNASINWTSGATSMNIISMSTLWAPGIRDGASGAWYISFAVPIGSIVYLYIFMKKRKRA